MSTIAFIGVGTMGAPMAHNIAKGGHMVKAFDVADAALAAVAGDGIEATASPAEAARDADYIITMLPNASHVEAAAFGPNGLAEAMGSTALYIDMSTIAPAATDKLATRMAERGLAMIDAPVGRQQQHAIEGKLLIMVGGGDAEVGRALPILELMGDTIIHCGTTGTGSRMKIVNNYMSISLNVLSSEALLLAERSGLDPEIARKVMMGTVAGQGHFGTTYPAKVLKGDLEPGFMIDLAHKDLGLALEFAAQLNLSVATGAQAHKVYQQARDSGHGGRDWTAIYAVMRKQAGLD